MRIEALADRELPWPHVHVVRDASLDLPSERGCSRYQPHQKARSSSRGEIGMRKSRRMARRPAHWLMEEAPETVIPAISDFVA